jgi:hypothetical protein
MEKIACATFAQKRAIKNLGLEGKVPLDVSPI